MASSSPTSPSPNLQPAVPENTTNNNPHPLQCPRCNSSNTKFCYYNNYSLSQPRHFCKACKRYWTRGGTLRNVPVGGGCRKNKRPKLPNPKIDLPPQASTHDKNNSSSNNPLFCSNINQVNFPFPSFRSIRVCGDNINNTGFDFQPQVNGLGLGFSSGLMAAAANDSGIFYGSSSSSGFASSSTMASLLASKVEGDQERFGWNPDPNPNPNTNHDQINYYYSDPSSLIGAWFDPTNSNIGSSVPSLI